MFREHVLLFGASARHASVTKVTVKLEYSPSLLEFIFMAFDFEKIFF